jgi:phage terminase large subunit-like protein
MNFYFSDEHASRAVRFFAKQLRFVEGARAGKPFALELWQEKIVRDVFGWLRPDGTRRYRTAYIEIPRKNGKSSLCAGLALYLLLCDNEASPQVYSAAGDRGQAEIVFKAARAMVAANQRLEQEAKLRQYEIQGIRKGGWYKALSAESYTKHGLSAHGIIFDELHVQPNRELWDVLTTSTGARAQPLTIAITTAGFDRSSICWELHQHAKAVIADPELDPTFYGVIYGAEPEEDWTDPEVWARANPNLGVSLKLEYLEEACQRAKDNPEAENTFRNLHLNQWTQQAVRWLPMHQWDLCRQDFTAEDLRGRTCFAGLDLASTQDTNALALVFPEDDGSYKVLPYYWIPEDSKSDRAHQDRRQVLNWAAKGFITTTPGNVTDYEQITEDILELDRMFHIRSIAYDPHGPAVAFVQMLQARGFPLDRLTEFGQTIMNFSPPSKEFQRLIASGRFNHNGDPVLRWMAENVAALRDRNDNIRPDKTKSADKIDCIVASIMAMGEAIKNQEQAASIYDRESRGFIEIG